MSSSIIDIENRVLPEPSAPLLSSPDNSNYICIYCLGDEGSIYTNSLCPCVYMYHKKCMVKYINYRNSFYTCPMCRVNHIISSFQAHYFQKFLQDSSVPANSLARNEALNMQISLVSNRIRNNFIINIACSCLAGIIYLIILLICNLTSRCGW